MLVDYQAAPFNGPASLYASLLSGIAAAPFEGLWVPAAFAKSLAVVLGGTFSAISCEIWASSASDMPANQVTATIGGAVTATDTVGITFTSPLIPGGKTVSHAVVGGDSTTTIAAGVAAAINADATLSSLGIGAASANAVVTVSWPSYAPNPVAYPPGTGTGEPVANLMSFAGALSGGATETVTIGNGTNGFKAETLTAVGLTQISGPVRWIKARLATMTGSSAVVDLAGTI
jgi:hypothetical protein